MIAPSCDSSSEKKIRIPTIELIKRPIMIPENTITMFFRFFVRTERIIAAATLRIPAEKANSMVKEEPRPSIIDATAPTHAPDETPRMSGDTRGF